MNAPPAKRNIERVASAVVDSCLCVHRELGPGLLESVYQLCLTRELCSRGHHVICEVPVPVKYKGKVIDAGLRLDMVVEGLVLLENKSVTALLPVHQAQLLTYLKMSGYRVGFLISCNVPLIRDGITRMVNGL